MKKLMMIGLISIVSSSAFAGPVSSVSEYEQLFRTFRSVEVCATAHSIRTAIWWKNDTIVDLVKRISGDRECFAMDSSYQMRLEDGGGYMSCSRVSLIRTCSFN